MKPLRVWGAGLVAAACAMTAAGSALGATGDIHRVANAELVNLRAGPSEGTNVRSQLTAGQEVIELARDGNWVGVRVIPTGQEGWIYRDLLNVVARSALGGIQEPGDAGFLQLSEPFDRLVGSINRRLGYPIVAAVEQVDTSRLNVSPTQSWLVNASREAHMMAATAFYQLWKNYQNNGAVTLVMMDQNGREYITIQDAQDGPILSIADLLEPAIARR